MEVIRLCTWTQINTSNFIPTSFSVPFKVGGATNSGLQYYGTIKISGPPAGVPTAYSNDMRLVSVTLDWGTNSTMARHRQLYSYISRYGIQNYVE
jgi:hypothetical protein